MKKLVMTNKCTSVVGHFDGHGGALSWECQQHVGNTLVTCQNVANFGLTCALVPTQKLSRHKNFVSGITNKL
jgi:hypothetical protein